MSPERSPRGDARCAAVVAVARTILVEEGLERFVMREIASRSGMKLGNLQYYFPTRNDLLEAVIRAEFDRDVAAVRETTAEASFSSLGEELLRNWLSGGGGSIFATMSLLSHHDERFRSLSREIYETFYAELGDVIRRTDPAVDEAEILARARLITSVIDGVAIQTFAAVDDDETRTDLLERATTIVMAIAGGACGAPATG